MREQAALMDAARMTGALIIILALMAVVGTAVIGFMAGRASMGWVPGISDQNSYLRARLEALEPRYAALVDERAELKKQLDDVTTESPVTESGVGSVVGSDPDRG